MDKQDDQSTVQFTGAVPNRIASPIATTTQQSTDPAAAEPQYSDEDEKGLQSKKTADKTAGTSGDDTDTAPTSDGETARDPGPTTSEIATTNDKTSSRPKHREATTVSQRVESTRRVSLGHRPQTPTVRRDVRVSDADPHP